MLEWGTVELRELLWVLAAVPGLWFWFRNYLYARQTEKLTRSLDKTDGRSMWARFSVALTRGFMALEMVFVFIGARAMFTPQSPTQNSVTAWTTAVLFIMGSMVISYLGVRWKLVDDALVQTARTKRAVANKLKESNAEQVEPSPSARARNSARSVQSAVSEPIQGE